MLSPSSPFPFIVGCGRSGTTLLRSMFDTHPKMAIPGESGFLLRRRKRYETRAGFAANVLLHDLSNHPRFRLWGLSHAEVAEALREPPVGGYADAVRRLYALYARSRGKVRYADKTPAYVLHMPLLARLFPEARFVHLIRDGRDVALSYMSIPEWGPDDLAECALYWRRRVRTGRKDGASLGPERYREVRYEELVDDPENVLRSLCPFLDLAYDEGMLRYHQRAAEALELELQPHRHQGLRLPPRKGLRDWSREMPDSDVAVFEALCGDELSELGYERRFSTPGVGIRARAAAGVAVSTVRRLEGLGRAAGRRLVGTHRGRPTESFEELETTSRAQGR
jgi:hypothetical protein